MRRKKECVVLAVALMSFSLFTMSSSGESARLRIVVDSTDINADAKMIDNKVYVPIRAVSESLGANVAWDAKSSTVTVTKAKENDSLVPEILENVSPSVVGIIGDLKETDYDSKFKESLVHGTGVVVKENGEILTNAHVVKDMERIVVVLSDGSGYEAKLLHIDEDTDLALIKIQKNGLRAAKFGQNDDIVIGKTVIAIGTPISFSLRNSASMGIISGINRGIGSQYKLIQTDAAINPGNSGGPLVNLNGEVIGINSSKFSGTGIEGLGFSIPVDTVRYVLDQFYTNGKVRKADLGVDFEEDWAAKVGLPSNSGLTVSRVRESGHELMENDILLSIENDNTNTIVDFNEAIKKYTPGTEVSIKIKRGEIIKSIKVKLTEKK